MFGGGDVGFVDHEKAAAGEALLDPRPRLAEAREGSVVEDDADAGALPHASPPSMSCPALLWLPPRTRASKSASPAPFVPSSPLVVLIPPKLINSLRVVAGALFAPSSCSFRVCSFSTRALRDLMRPM